MKKYFLSLIFSFAITAVGYCYTYSDYDFNDFNGHQYALTLELSNWTQAEAWAIEVGGHLATINDNVENTWLAAFITAGNEENEWYSYGTGWIGLEYISGNRNSPDSWQWTSDEPVTFFNYPADLYYEGTHMYLHGSDHPVSPGKWNCNPVHDSYPGDYLPGVIEIVPEPTTILLLGFGGLTLLRKRRTTRQF